MRGGQASSKSRAKNLVSKLIDPLGLGQWGMEREGASVIPGILGTCSTELSTLRWSRWMPFPREYPTSSLWNLTQHPPGNVV